MMNKSREVKRGGIIQLNGMTFEAFHGVSEQEKKEGNLFTIDVEVGVDLSKAIQTDALSDTLDYSRLYDLIQDEMTIPSNLLEHVAGRIIDRILSSFLQVETVTIKLSKLNPPIGRKRTLCQKSRGEVLYPTLDVVPHAAVIIGKERRR